MDRKKQVLTEYRLEEAKLRGRGLIRFLSELQWIRNAEWDHEKPYEEKRILLKRRLWFMGLGAGTAVSFHFGISLITTLSAFLVGLADERLGEFMNVVGIVFKTVLLVGFPVWVLKHYFLWDRGITKRVLVDFVFYGYVPTAVVLTVVSALMFLLFSTGVLVGSKFSSQVHFLLTKFPYFFTWWNFGEYILQIVLLIFYPLYTLKKLEKTHKFTQKPYSILDEVPSE